MPPLARFPLRRDQIYEFTQGREVPNMDVIRQHLLGEGKFHRNDLVELFSRTIDILEKEPNLALL